MDRQSLRLALFSAAPLLALLLVSFAAPLLLVAAFSIMPQNAFDLAHLPDFSSYAAIAGEGYLKSLFWSVFLAFASTTILFLVCWPLAHGMVRVFGRFSLVITVAVVVSLFVSENIRLFGWVVTLMKGGLIEGHLRALTGVGFEGALFNVPIIVFGLVYVYLPFMLFPLVQGIAMIPDDMREAAADLGATRWQILREVDLPLAAPGIVVGGLLSFALAAGALAESKLLGGQAVVVLADDIETAFTYGQNWPLGSALSMMLILIIAAIAAIGVSRVDIDRVMGGRRA